MAANQTLIQEGNSLMTSSNGIGGSIRSNLRHAATWRSVVDSALSSDTCANMLYNAPGLIAQYNSGDDVNCVVIWPATNDIYNNDPVDRITANIRDLCLAHQAAGAVVVLVGELPRDDFPFTSRLSGDATAQSALHESRRQEISTWERANWQSFADGFVDLAADTTVGEKGDELNTTYYDADKVHLSATGKSYIGNLVADAVDTAVDASWHKNWTGGYQDVELLYTTDGIAAAPLFLGLRQMDAELFDAAQSSLQDLRVSDPTTGRRLPFVLSGGTDAGDGTLYIQPYDNVVTGTTVRLRTGNAAVSAVPSDVEHGSAVALSGKVFYFPNGLGNDATANANNQTLTGSPTAGDSDGPILGNKGTGLSGSQYGRFAFTTIPATVVMAYKSATVSTQETLFSIGDSAGNNNYAALVLQNDVDRTGRAVMRQDATTVTSTGQVMPRNLWSTIGWRYATNVLQAVVDGVAATVQTTAVTPGSLDFGCVGALTRSTVATICTGVVGPVIADSTLRAVDWIAFVQAQFISRQDQSEIFRFKNWVRTSDDYGSATLNDADENLIATIIRKYSRFR